MDNFFKKRVVYSVPGLDAVHAERDLRYKSTEGEGPLMDIYMPPSLPDGEVAPGIIFIHGGPLEPDTSTKPKDWGVYISYGQLAAASGFAGVMFNHRFPSFAHLEQASSDVMAAIDYVREKGDALRIDRDRLGLWAFSGGGSLLSFALREQTSYIRCVASFYAALDRRSLDVEYRQGASDELLARFSPLAYLQRDPAPTLPFFIGRAGQDNQELNETVDAFIAQALAINLPLEVANHPGGHHAFDILDDEPRSRALIKKALAFFHEHLT